MSPTVKIVLASAIVSVIAAGIYYQTKKNTQAPLEQTQSVAAQTPAPAVATIPEVAVKAPPQKPKAAPKPATKEAEEEEEAANVLELADANPNFETFNDRYQDIVNRRAGRQFDPNELYEAMQEPGAWQAADKAPDTFDLTDKQKNDGRVFIRFSPMKLESLARGDKLEISIANAGVDFTATINEVRSDSTGSSVTWEGTSDSPDSTDKITITKGDTLVVGGIFTDDGLYQLEVKDGQGYIVSSATLFRHGQDQTVEVPQHLIDNPPDEYVELEVETHGG